AEKKKPAAATPAPAPKTLVRDVSPTDAEKLMAERKDVVVIDVRTIEEYEMGHIAGAQNVSFIDNGFEEKIGEYAGKPVMIHCAAGNRSLRALQRMMAGGKFPEIFHMSGGMAGWQEAGKTVVKTPKAPK
ncbi:MAG: rhodanese-like domain-containing protein, partial [Chthoniobacteraceae bacterium]